MRADDDMISMVIIMIILIIIIMMMVMIMMNMMEIRRPSGEEGASAFRLLTNE